MAEFDQILGAKLAMLETLVINLYASGFEETSRPIAAVKGFADQYRRSFEQASTAGTPEGVLNAEVWNALLDQLVAEVERRVAKR